MFGNGSRDDEEDEKFLVLQKRKEALESLLSDKCQQLKNLCLAEAELTGTVPMEMPNDENSSQRANIRSLPKFVPISNELMYKLKTKQVSSKGRLKRSPKSNKRTCLWSSKSLTSPKKCPENFKNKSPGKNRTSYSDLLSKAFLVKKTF